MNINRLTIGQKVWTNYHEFPEQETIVRICKEKNEVELTDGHIYGSSDIYSSKRKCKESN